ncbi:ribose 5-phosphate isomerase B [Alkalihalobacillus sp. R86527]|uniref:ribose 5-phosphate isomerase B n=1 Tax=Alkalihalobacillus sp. R86527 TaxID=3093863 RepID=UPI00366BE978
MKVGLGADHNGFEFKEEIKKYLENTLEVEVVDFGCHSCDAVDYPAVAFEVGTAINNGEVDRGIIICGTGLGVAIAANKIPGIRAATCHDVYSAERAQLSNNAQILTMGSQVIGPEAGKKIVRAYLDVQFKSSHKVQQIIDKENEIHNAKL